MLRIFAMFRSFPGFSPANGNAHLEMDLATRRTGLRRTGIRRTGQRRTGLRLVRQLPEQIVVDKLRNRSPAFGGCNLSFAF